jgi:hypothetical protein
VAAHELEKEWGTIFSPKKKVKKKATIFTYRAHWHQQGFWSARSFFTLINTLAA